MNYLRAFLLLSFSTFLSFTVSSQNLLDLSGWKPGSGTAPSFSANGSSAENIREWGIGPDGKRAILWKAIPDATSDADGGWNGSTFPVDHTKMYRYVVWLKKTNSHDGNSYFGCYGATGSVSTLNGSPHANPYFWAGDLPELDKWYLLIGYIHGSGDNSTTSYGKIYDGETGEAVQNIADFKFQTTATVGVHRTYLYYDVNTADRQYFYAPRVDEVNGNEPSVAQLLGLAPNQLHGPYVSKSITLENDLNANVPINFIETKADGSPDYVGGLYWDGANDVFKLTSFSDADVVLNTTNGGNVGIGTATPTEKLDVDGNTIVRGNIETTQVKVSATPGSVPDYVFRPGYQLLSLSQLEAYIKVNSHLPNIPSAREVEQDGQNLGALQLKLLEKIEELTLHVIDLKKENESLKKRVVEIENNSKHEK